MFRGAKVVELEPIAIKDPIVVEGFPGIGLVANIAAGQLIHELKMKYVGFVRVRTAPMAILHKGIAQPPIRVYAKDNLILFYSDIFIFADAVFDVTEAIVNWLEEHKPRIVYTLAGISVVRKSEAVTVYGVASSPQTLEEIKKHEVQILGEGGVTGIPGTLMTECAARKIPAICLLAETFGNRPDPGAAAELVKLLNKFLGLSVDTSILIEEAERIEAELRKLVEQMKAAKREARPPPEEIPMYY